MTPTEKTPARPFWVLLLQRDSEDVLYEATAMTAAAVSLGIDVTLIWFDAALEALVSGRLSEEEAGGAGNAGTLLREAREAGTVRLLACSASMVNRRVDRDVDLAMRGRHRRMADGDLAHPLGGTRFHLVIGSSVHRFKCLRFVGSWPDHPISIRHHLSLAAGSNRSVDKAIEIFFDPSLAGRRRGRACGNRIGPLTPLRGG